MTTDLIDCPFRHDQKRMCVKGDTYNGTIFPVTIKIVSCESSLSLYEKFY